MQAYDVVCGMTVDTKTAPSADYKGSTYYFCCTGCRGAFERSPDYHLQNWAEEYPGKSPTPSAQDGDGSDEDATAELDDESDLSDPFDTVSLEEAESAEDLSDGPSDDMAEAVEEGRGYSPPTRIPMYPSGDDGGAMTGDGVGDDALERLVLDALARNPATSGLELDVAVDEGLVRLEGVVDTAADAEAAVGTALAVNGVERVESSIDVMD